MQKLLQREGSVHVFNDQATLEGVAEAIIQNGEFTGTLRGHDRYGLYFDEAIGYRLDAEFTSSSYPEAKLWLLEDEYERVEG